MHFQYTIKDQSGKVMFFADNVEAISGYADCIRSDVSGSLEVGSFKGYFYNVKDLKDLIALLCEEVNIYVIEYRDYNWQSELFFDRKMRDQRAERLADEDVKYIDCYEMRRYNWEAHTYLHMF